MEQHWQKRLRAEHEDTVLVLLAMAAIGFVIALVVLQ